MTPSKYQQAIYDTVVNTACNLIIVAVAGSGKSTTLKHVYSLLKGSRVMLAFNAAIAKELRDAGMQAKTFHSLCLQAVLNFKKLRSADDVTGNKLSRIIKATFSSDDAHNYGAFCTKLVGLARNNGVGIDGLMPDTFEAWERLVQLHDIDLDDANGCTIERGIELAHWLLEESNNSPMIDWDDVLYMAVKFNLPLSKFANVMVDEAQDTNAIQREIIRRILARQWNDSTVVLGRLIAVGDPAQAIYAFRGADSNALNLIASEFKCVEMPLSISYRCAPVVVEYARQWVNHIEANPDRHDIGGVVNLDTDWLLDDFEETDLVICRTTRPLISLAMRRLQARLPVRIMGRDIGEGLIKFIKSMDANSIDDLETKLLAYKDREVTKAQKAGEDSKIEAINDKVGAIHALMGALTETNRTVDALFDVLKELFNENKKAVTLATIHKSKGLEARTVYWLNRSQCPSRWARQEWQQKQEQNLMYVATTRAKVSLRMIEETARAV
jgi:superfamily I DNA/RNA helicase